MTKGPPFCSLRPNSSTRLLELKDLSLDPPEREEGKDPSVGVVYVRKKVLHHHSVGVTHWLPPDQ